MVLRLSILSWLTKVGEKDKVVKLTYPFHMISSGEKDNVRHDHGHDISTELVQNRSTV